MGAFMISFEKGQRESSSSLPGGEWQGGVSPRRG
ncbi:hypothetical protein A2U01_0069237, partial [Trifolium medium]|nr:hypothetical protein [Trifolium medium]